MSFCCSATTAMDLENFFVADRNRELAVASSTTVMAVNANILS